MRLGNLKGGCWPAARVSDGACSSQLKSMKAWKIVMDYWTSRLLTSARRHCEVIGHRSRLPQSGMCRLWVGGCAMAVSSRWVRWLSIRNRVTAGQSDDVKEESWDSEWA